MTDTFFRFAPPKAIEVGQLSPRVTRNLAEFKNHVATHFYVMEKLDGCNTTCIVQDGELQVFSRTGKRVRDNLFGPDFTTRISDAALSVFGERSGVFFGEAWSPALLFEEISGRFRAGSGEPLEFHAFDCVSLPDYNTGVSNVPFKVRLTAVHEAGLRMPNTFYPLWSGWGELYSRIHKLVRKGCDGLILRDPDAGWVGNSKGTDGTIIKMKPRLEETGRVIQVHTGKGRLHSLVGAVDVQMLDSDDVIRVGSGIPDNIRELGQALVGQYVEVASLGRTKNGARREPTIKGVRSDMFMEDSRKRA